MRFGRSMLDHWLLDPEAVYLNHGTVGVTPRRVLAAQQALRDEIERHPARFMFRELMSLELQPAGPAQPALTRLRCAAEQVGAFLGAKADNLVFVDNASAGVSAVLRSLPLAAGDEIVLFDHAYGAVSRAAGFVARERGATVVTVALPFPLADPEDCGPLLEAALTPRTRLVILDHVTSDTALVLPVARLAALCHAHGVPVLVDGAHAPGAIALDIESLGADWYVANLHKWAFAPRGCGLLWAAPQRQAGLHPPVISWGLDVGWQQEFAWTGTRDPTPALCAPAGIAFITEVLGEQPMRDYKHALVWRAAQSLSRRWGRDWTQPESLTECMATVPLPARLAQGDAAVAGRLRDWLLAEHRIEVPIIVRNGRLWVRVSAQVYNDDEDIERLAHAIDAATNA